MKRIFVIGLLLMLCTTAVAQRYSLQQCIDTALKRNVGVRQSALLTEAADVNLKQARAALLPDLNASLNHGLNQGRSIDPFTNTFVNQSITYAGYGLSSGVTLFNAGNLRNSIKQAATASDASRMEWQQAKDNLVLNVMLAYLQVLSTEDLLTAAGKQKELSAKQIERLEVLDRQGTIAPSVLADLRGQVMNDDLNILNLRNSLAAAKLALAQLMNIPFNPNMTLDRVDADGLLEGTLAGTDDVYRNALDRFALVKAVELRKQSAAYGLKAAKGLLYPSLALGSNMQTNFSSIAADNNGKIPYKRQLDNNLFYSFNLGLRVPLFNGFRVRNNIKLADIAVRNSQLVEEGTKQQLRQQIEQAHLNAVAAFDRYKTLVQQVAAYNTSFKAAEARFTAGVGNSVDYLIAKNNLDRANINLIAAKYDYVLRTRVLDFYQQSPDIK